MWGIREQFFIISRIPSGLFKNYPMITSQMFLPKKKEFSAKGDE
jgi:hypothetical protein